MALAAWDPLEEVKSWDQQNLEMIFDTLIKNQVSSNGEGFNAIRKREFAIPF